ncbi:DUF4359 domain-containing protein [Sphingobacterium sp. LRF_L2]|uniref:DUF4359 domain-containing protein n=1 Tax=Sphingobacterium sp. LRF_L2 TaxID=3369421 RepID=UPI003F638E31
MSKTRIFSLSTIVLMLVAFFTNPSNEQHEEAVRIKALELLQQHTGKNNDNNVLNLGVQLFGNTLVDQFMKNHIHVQNYYLFSVTKVTWEDKEQIIGLGMFKKVWLSAKIDDMAADVVNMIKGK